jgi:hypothetical protein
LFESLPEYRDASLTFWITLRPVHEDTDPAQLLALLRERRKWPCRSNTTDKADKLPSLQDGAKYSTGKNSG